MSLRSSQLVPLFAALAMAGCNMVTGADGLTIADDDAASRSSSGSSGAGGSSSGSGNGSTGSGSGSTGSGTQQQPMAAVDGVSITDIVLYQSVARPIMAAGQTVDSNIPVVANRPALMRVFFETDGAYNGEAVTARLTVGSSVLEGQATLSGSSSEGAIDSTINFDVPVQVMTTGASYRVELLQTPDKSSGTNAAATFPSAPDEQESLGAQAVGTLHVKLVPVQYNNDGSGRLPDTSAAQLKKYEDLFYSMYPVADVDIQVRSPMAYNGAIAAGGNGWNNLLNAVADLRQNDNAPLDTYYYGIFNPRSSFQNYCSGGCVLGLGFVGGAMETYTHAAIGIGYSGDRSVETAVHELGHNHGREHAPCGTSGDSSYPYNGASIGVYGYDLLKRELYSPGEFVDMMSYCDPAWISDYNFLAIFNRVKTVNAADVYTPPQLMNRTYQRILIDDQGNGSWMSPITMKHPPVGEVIDVTVQTGNGPETTNGHFYAYDHIDGGVMFVSPTQQPMLTNSAFSTVVQGKPISYGNP